jgi:asparagine synthase (glutamine-hydrolysing)
MCGILTIVNNKINAGSANLIRACSIIRHRGPDDEGFLTWVPGEGPKIWAGSDTAASTLAHWRYDTLAPGQQFKVGFGHRRLSILDLSPAGHQPMRLEEAGLSITFNGEVYNYLEIRAELEALGNKFVTKTDTEVILQAWAKWGVECLHKFNGMFAFVLLDERNKFLYAVRDRFGVKPLFYYAGATALYLASEIKQIRTAPDYTLSLNEKIARQYLASGAVDHTNSTFDNNINHLPSGHYLQVNLSADNSRPEIKPWYTLRPKIWKGSYDDAVVEFRHLLSDAVRLRLRSDVTVGSCLSGGLDSSSIVCIIADLLAEKGDHSGQETVTACYENARFDEWDFAAEVIRKTNAKAHRTFPSFKQLETEMDAFIWHQDEPTGSTSQFSQWAVFKASHEAGLKVMVDGQGADEQLAGYGGNDLPLYTGLMRKAKFAALIDEAKSYKKEKGVWPIGFLLSALKLNMGKPMLPANAGWVQGTEPSVIFDRPATSLNENLLRQVYGEPLPALLRYEDHSSMAWSVESRTPFMDYRLMEFNLGLPEQFIYKRGIRKTILRDAMHNIIPEAIENRKDKMGFVTPEELWLRGEGKQWFKDCVEKASKRFGGHLLDATFTRNHVNNMIDGKETFSYTPWRILCFNKWYEMIDQ